MIHPRHALVLAAALIAAAVLSIGINRIVVTDGHVAASTVHSTGTTDSRSRATTSRSTDRPGRWSRPRRYPHQRCKGVSVLCQCCSCFGVKVSGSSTKSVGGALPVSTCGCR